MARIIEARVRQKAATLEEWNNSDLDSLDGEQLFVRSDVDDKVIGFKLGAKGKKFSELDYPDLTVRGKVSPTSSWSGRQSGVYIPTSNGVYNGVNVNLTEGYQVLYWDGNSIEKVVYPIDYTGSVFGGVIDDSEDLSTPPSEPTWYIASAGDYNTVPPITLTENSILTWDGNEWSHIPFELEVRGEFLVADNIAEVRNITPEVAQLLVNGTYKGVEVLGYYEKGDTPASIIYYLSDTTEEDDGGSVIEVGGVKLEHKFEGEINIKYFGMFNGTSDDTDKLNHISNLAGAIGGKMVVPNTVDPFMIFPRLRGEGSVRERGFIPKSNVEYIFEPGARFKIIPVPNNSYCGISIYNIENTVFRNLTIIGERDEHYFGDNPNNKYVMFENNKSYTSGQYVESGENGWIVTVSGISDSTNSLPTNTGTVTIGQTITNGTATFQVVALNLGQWGHCIEIYESKNITFYDLKADKAWGDGVFIGVTDGVSEEDMNNQINFLGNTQSINCRRQAISVITAKNSYIESLYAEDVKGHQPMAAIDFEPNFDWHVIDNFYVNQVTAVRCHRSTQFSSRSNFYDVTINNVNAIDCDLPPTFEGLQHTVQRVIPSRITINNWNVNTLNNTPPVRMYNWYPDFNGYVNIGNINIGNWQVDSAGSAGSFLNLVYSRPSTSEMIDMGGVTIDNYNVSKYSINPSVELRPFFLSFNNPTIDSATRIGKINLNIPVLYGVNEDDSNTNIPIDISTVNVRKKQTELSNVFRSTGTTLLLKNGDYVYQTNPTLTVTINRRGFKEAIIVNSSSNDKVMTMVGGSSSGITTFTGQGGINQSGNVFTINPSSVVKITRISDSEIIVALMNIGNRNASTSVKGLVNQGVHVPDGSSIDTLLASLRAAGIIASS